jgi:transketolase
MTERRSKAGEEKDEPTRRELANAIRALSMDAVQKANSGHPGAPMGMADIAEVLWRDYLNHNPNNPSWFNRDRFVLSNGHGSMLIYSLLHLTGYDVSIEDIKNFRQLGSITPGHPEYGDTPGVETTTGPLGQGLANAVGMAIAEKHLASVFNRREFNLIDHKTYVFVGDGCLMEGISHEACGLAGALGLGKLIVMYDDNGISIDGDVKGWFTDNTPARFESYGWHVVENIDGHNHQQLQEALAEAHVNKDQPSILCCKTKIGWGSPNKEGKSSSHGAPLGLEEIEKTREALQWDHAPFEIPRNVRNSWNAAKAGQMKENSWRQLFHKYKEKYPDAANEFERTVEGQLPETLNGVVSDFIKSLEGKREREATRKSSESVLNVIGSNLPELLGGSADLTGSNNTLHSSSSAFSKDNPNGNYIYYGVREFAMSGVMNGMALHGGIIPYGGTFLVFSDYARNAVRMAALMKIRSIFVYTHDSIGLGEDGPTHQPVEHLSSLRLIPDLDVWRPSDSTETAIAWHEALKKKNGPTCVVLTRQALPAQKRNKHELENIKRGGYILEEPPGAKKALIIATGSELELARETAVKLNEDGAGIQVISMPCKEVFLRQNRNYRDQVLPPALNKRIAIEAGSRESWYQFVGSTGLVLGIDSFGASGPAPELFEHFALDAESCLKEVSSYLDAH